MFLRKDSYLLTALLIFCFDTINLQEWCSILCSYGEGGPIIAETNRQRFFHIASRDDRNSLLYHRDLPFLMDISVKVSEFGLALSLGESKSCRFVYVHICL